MVKIFEIALVLAALAVVTVHSQGPVCMCPKIYSPVCGSDSRTYGNKCELNCAKKNNRAKTELTIRSVGRCEEVDGKGVEGQDVDTPERSKAAVKGCFCTREYKPVCANNGRTFSNKCEFECEQKGRSELRIVRTGACDGDDAFLIP